MAIKGDIVRYYGSYYLVGDITGVEQRTGLIVCTLHSAKGKVEMVIRADYLWQKDIEVIRWWK